LVGSLPHREPGRIVERIIGALSEMPAWPQLPARDFRESMYLQYCEGLPGAVVDRQAERLTFSTEGRFQDELERFYQAVVEIDVERFAISRDHALGLHLFLERLGAAERRPAWVKGQVTGPFSFAMTVTDENKRALAYHPELLEVAVQGMAMKARWSARRLRAVAEHALVVVDEPYLCSFGSAFVNVPRDTVVGAIGTAVEAIHQEGCLAGIHCCGNTDWALCFETGIDVLNLDAFEFFQGLPLYPEELGAFVDRGGVLSLGIIPTSDAVIGLDAAALDRALGERIALLERKGLDRARLFRQCLITPSCGLGSKSEAVADRVLDLLGELGRRLRDRGSFA
jgi:methionine synthase II (cobalamin-independent)